MKKPLKIYCITCRVMRKARKVILILCITVQQLQAICYWAINVVKIEYLDELIEKTETQDYLIANEKIEQGNIFSWHNSFLAWVIKILLRITIMAWVSLTIVTGIKMMLSWWDEWKFGKSLNQLVRIAAWIILALSAFWIINLLESTAQSVNIDNMYNYDLSKD